MMNRMQFAACLLGGVLFIGCGASVQHEEPVERDTTVAPPARIATGPASVQTQTRPSSPDGPPYLFTPPQSTPKNRYRDYREPDLRTLPKLKMQFRQCFAEEEHRRLGPTRGRLGTVKRRSSSSGGAVTHSASKPSSKSASSGKKPRSQKPSSPPAVIKQKVAEGTIPLMPSQEPAASSAPPPPSAAESKGKRDSRRKEADERAAAPMAAADFAEAEETAEPDYAPAPKQRIAIDDDAEDAPPETDDAFYGQFNDWGQAIYLSNDDTMSLSSAQRVIYAIDNFLPLPSAHIRPHELLNYFSFETTDVTRGSDFSVHASLEPDPRETGIYSLGMAVNGRPVDKKSRRNAVITLVIDRSGSMRAEGRMDYLKQGLLRMIDELKYGDIVHVILFDHTVCVPAQNFVVGRDHRRKLEKVINALEPRGSTDLHRGLSLGYDIADQSYQKDYSNRVVMVTDALTNTGVTDEQLISMISKYYDKRRIRLSGVGVGRDFNDGLLDRLTERGKGAYVFLGSNAEVNAVFGSHFISLIETTALDVHFRLHLPPSLRMNVFYGEESSTQKADVQEIHYFANTSQLFLSDLMARGGVLRPQDGVMLTIEYKDPETGAPLQEAYAFELRQLMANTRNVKKARLIMAWVDMLAAMAARPAPSYSSGAGTWQDPEAWHRCDEGQTELARLAKGLENDPEVTRVKELLVKYCARYERPRYPVKRQIPTQDQSWPGAR